MNQKKELDISVVLPCYKSAYFINELHARITKTCLKLAVSYEIIFVNDGSPDNDKELITKLCSLDKHTVGIELSRNFGQHAAIYAGISSAKGQWVVVMDSDLQDEPEIIEQLYLKIKKGYDAVIVQRTTQDESWFKINSSKLFYQLLNTLAEVKIPYNIGNFGIYHQNLIKSILELKDYKRNFAVMAHWVGFKKAYHEAPRNKRKEGKSFYTLKKMLNFAFNTIIYFSNKPLIFIIKLGFLTSSLSLLTALYYISRKYLIGTAISGWTSLIVSIFFMGGIQISLIGIVGVYIGQIFYQTKKRPSYIIKTRDN